ncbi:MAG: T9SS type A sorting domain-containing protein [Dysgonamonadaceae bacterium]|jgi:hypothetical protein|nr:T9SS type A sorting domain-containing protein [Dysgonamonadaceae bacterium]
MKKLLLFFALFCLSAALQVSAQVSYGGRPRTAQMQALRAVASLHFFEMPKFNLDSVLAEDRVAAGELRRPYRFAYKFYTNIDKSRDGELSILADGTKVWRIGIRSGGAASINLLLTDFLLPKGGKLFVYSADNQSYAGAFDERNNSPQRVLPIRPIAGDAVIVEYSEPWDAEFEGNFIISEVNHDYRGVLRAEPGSDNGSAYLCMPDALCGGLPEEIIRSTVLVILNGSTLFSGSLVNNTAEDGRPYMLTAVHCLNNEFPAIQTDEYYRQKAATAIAFFNYNRPFCDNSLKIKGTEEMSIAIAEPRVIYPENDIALLEFQETPPDYYNAYYAGWNIADNGKNPPYTNLHHPNAAVKKYGIANSVLDSANFNTSMFQGLTHWRVNYWSVGSTYSGSSGSPLFNSNGLIIGGLTGGSSTCSGSLPGNESDYFYILGNGWITGNAANQLKTYLNPLDIEVASCQGLDPNSQNPLIRLSHIDYSAGDALIASRLSEPDEGYVFGNSNRNTTEFAEEFSVAETSLLKGVFLYLPKMYGSSATGVEISVYSGNNAPENKLATAEFSAKYLNYTSGGGFAEQNKNLAANSTENFVLFDDSVKVNGKFFVSYSINYSTTADFCVYNAQFGEASKANTAWLKNESGVWQKASDYPLFAKNTALAVTALLVKCDSDNGISQPYGGNSAYYDRKSRLLTVDVPDSQGWISVYSVDGQLIRKFAVQFGRNQYSLDKKPAGTVAIIRFEGGKTTFVKKIIL